MGSLTSRPKAPDRIITARHAGPGIHVSVRTLSPREIMYADILRGQYPFEAKPRMKRWGQNGPWLCYAEGIIGISTCPEKAFRHFAFQYADLTVIP